MSFFFLSITNKFCFWVRIIVYLKSVCSLQFKRAPPVMSQEVITFVSVCVIAPPQLLLSQKNSVDLFHEGRIKLLLISF